MTLEASVLAEDAVRRAGQHYEVDLHLPWYRSLPLSCLEGVDLRIGGQAAAQQDLRVLRGGESLTLADLASRIDDEWFVQDPITVAVPATPARAPGEDVDVEVTLTIRVPYILVGPGKALTRPTRVRRRLVLR